MPEFLCGAGGALIVDSRDETRRVHRYMMQDGRDGVETTTLQSPDFAKTMAYGLLGGAVNANGYSDIDPTTLSAQMATALGKNRDKHLVLCGPGGLAVGYEANFFETKSASVKCDSSVSGLTTLDQDFVLSKNGILDGVSQHNPHGASAAAQNAVQTVTLTNTPAVQEHAFRATGTTEVFKWTPSTTNSQMKAGLEALAAYAGRTITVTGLDTLTGTTTKSGTVVITFDGYVDVPLLECRASEAQSLVVTSGNNGNYTWNGGANFQMGVSESTLQTNVRATGGNWANVVVKGSSVGAGSSNVTVAGGGQVDYMGEYAPNGTLNGYTKYEKASDRLFRTAANDPRGAQYQSKWIISNGEGTGASIMYYSTVDSPTVPSTGWTSGAGADPAPTVTPPTASPYTASFVAYFPYDVGNITQGAVSGTGAVASTINQGGAAATTVSIVKTLPGHNTEAIYNVTTATGNDSWVDGGAQTTTGYSALLSVLYLLGSGVTATIAIEHAPDNGSNAPDTGNISTLCTFTAASGKTVEMLRATGTVKRWTRAKITISGTSPKVVWACALARN